MNVKQYGKIHNGKNDMKRSGKFYRKNEREIMKSLGLRPTYNSGSGWIEKEDGENEYIICQLKSTDAQSIKINQKDIRVLENNALVSHKLPLFAIQFLNTDEVWLMAKPEDFTEISEYINTGSVENMEDKFVFNDIQTNDVKVSNKIIKSSSEAKEQYRKERENKFNKTRSAI